MYIVWVYLCIANDKNLEGFEVYIGLTKQKAEINYSHKEQKSDKVNQFWTQDKVIDLLLTVKRLSNL